MLSAALTEQLTWGFALLGLLYFAKLTWGALYYILRLVYIYLLPRFVSVEKQLSVYGKWAVITGCTDGIGKEYAIQLAQAGMNVVLVSRSADKLRALQLEIESSYQVDTRIVAVDFGKQALIYDTIRIELRGLDIGVLVNNVGTDFQYLKPFLEVPEDEPLAVLNCNISSVVMMTQIVLPTMLKKRKGLIINVGSLLGLVPMPGEAVYSATKAFVDSFTRTLTVECEPHGIEVQLIMPGYVATKLSGKSTVSLFVKSPQSFVRSCLHSITRSNRCCGCIPHELQRPLLECTMRLLPVSLMRLGVNLVGQRINEERRVLNEKLRAAATKTIDSSAQATAAAASTIPKESAETSIRPRKGQK